VGGVTEVVVNKDNQILVVKEKGNPRYSVPEGGINRGELKMSAAVRELYEELKVSARRAEYLGRFERQRAFQYVYKIEAPGSPRPDPKEILD